MSENGWIGVDLDGTLAEYHGWDNGKIGKPIPLMLERVKDWLENGVEVRIMTARVAPQPDPLAVPGIGEIICAIEAWCKEHIGRVLPVTHEKDFQMIELWDDRAIQVIPNTGIRVDGLR